MHHFHNGWQIVSRLGTLFSVTLARKFVIAVGKAVTRLARLRHHVYPCYTFHRKETIMTDRPPQHRLEPGEYGFPLKLKARYDNFIGGEW
ncbi:hypothetical protein ACNKHL_21830 [Shigella flexneri]